MTPGPTLLLEHEDPSPVVIENRDGISPFVLACDHADRVVPRRLGDLGVPAEEIARHIGWDIGALAVSQLLARALDAPLVAQRYSRLVIDCNRRPGVTSSIPAISDGTPVPGNLDLDDAARARRVVEIFDPYHDALRDLLDARRVAGRRTVLIAMHSFTPMLLLQAQPRPWQIGILFNRDARLARALLGLLREDVTLCVGENEPYAVGDETDYTVPVQGERRGLPHVEIEIRQDLVGDAAGQAEWAARMAAWLPEAWGRVP